MANKSSFALFQYAEVPRILRMNAHEFSESSGFSLNSPLNNSPAVIHPVLPNDYDLICIAIDTESRDLIFSSKFADHSKYGILPDQRLSTLSKRD